MSNTTVSFHSISYVQYDRKFPQYPIFFQTMALYPMNTGLNRPNYYSSLHKAMMFTLSVESVYILIYYTAAGGLEFFENYTRNEWRRYETTLETSVIFQSRSTLLVQSTTIYLAIFVSLVSSQLVSTVVFTSSPLVSSVVFTSTPLVSSVVFRNGRPSPDGHA
jgi:hypothetical protein